MTPSSLLPREYLLAICVPTLVELTLVFVRPFLRNVVRSMVRAGREVQEERLIWSDLLEVAMKPIALSARSAVK